mgnify:CR=1 FL=1
MTLWSMIRVAQEISCVMPTASDIECTGVNIFMANGHSAGQEVMHVFDGLEFSRLQGWRYRQAGR